MRLDPFTFWEPDAAAIERLRDALGNLAFSGEDIEDVEESRPPDLGGDLDHVVGSLKDLLNAAYRKGLLETENELSRSNSSSSGKTRTHGAWRF